MSSSRVTISDTHENLARDGIRVSHVIVHKILVDNGMGTRSDRLLRLEERHCRKALALPVEQVALIERANPCCSNEMSNRTALAPFCARISSSSG